ncbi:MAG TPA: methyl-accepting chemotaxis protein [Candidatus Omnitrophota bacterium]|nr:methyl-accepting chemotaxis protein [Candidatus Omnitrophota bacterium]
MIKLKRRRFLVRKDMQFRYIGLVVIPLLAFLAGLYYLIYYCVFNEILIPEALSTTLLPAMKKVNIVLVFSLPVILFFIVRMALIYSNRIIGPIPRLEKKLDRIIAGDYSLRLETREKDELKGFINKINLLLEKIYKV